MSSRTWERTAEGTPKASDHRARSDSPQRRYSETQLSTETRPQFRWSRCSRSRSCNCGITSESLATWMIRFVRFVWENIALLDGPVSPGYERHWIPIFGGRTLLWLSRLLIPRTAHSPGPSYLLCEDLLSEPRGRISNYCSGWAEVNPRKTSSSVRSSSIALWPVSSLDGLLQQGLHPRGCRR